MENPRKMRSQEASARQPVIGLDAHFRWTRTSPMPLTLHFSRKTAASN